MFCSIDSQILGSLISVDNYKDLFDEVPLMTVALAISSNS